MRMNVNSMSADKQALEVLKDILPARSLTYVKTLAAQPGMAAKILMDFERLNFNPYKVLPVDTTFALHEETPGCLMEWAATVPGYQPHLPKMTVELPFDIMTPSNAATNEDTVKMLETMGYTQRRVSSGVWDIAGMPVDLVNFRIGDDAIMSHSAVITPLGNAVRLDREATMYLLVSMMIRYSKADVLKSHEAACIREFMKKIASAFDSKKMGESDPVRKHFELSKTAVLTLTFDHFGWGLVEGGIKDKGLVYNKLAHKIVGLGGHNQGKYWVPFAATGIYVADGVMHSATGAPITSTLVGLEDASKLNVEAIVGSTDLAKWFKRHTLGMLEAARLVNPETGYMKMNGLEQKGIRTPILVVMGGISLPYKGAATALAPRRVIGNHLAHYREWVYRDRWIGELPVRGMALGASVREGDVLANGGPGFELKAKRYGTVLEHKSLVVDGETLVSVNVGTEDRTGQVKGRDMSGLKISVSYTDFTAIPWAQAYAALGLTGHVHACGDTSVFGLKPGDNPMLEIPEDGMKGTGKGIAWAEVNLMAETLKRHVDYSVYEQFHGAYDKDLEEFESVAHRRVTTLHSVDFTTYKIVEKAIAEGAAHPGVTVHQLDLSGKPYYVVKQEADAYMAYTLLKVESLPVADNLTVQRTPGEVAVTANTVGMNLVADYLDEKGDDQIADYLALQHAAWSIFVQTKAYQGIAQALDGHQVTSFCVNVNNDLPQAVKDRLQFLSESSENILSLKEPLIIGRFDEKGNPHATRDQEDQAVILDPKVLKAFGGGRDESSIESQARQLCMMVANDNLTDPQVITDINRAIARVKGALQRTASVESVAKRVVRGAPAVSARTRPGYINPNWVAMSYYGNVARELAVHAGWKGNGHPTDRLWGQAAIMYRSPQTTPTPQRIYFPDAPADAVEAAKLLGNWPQGAERFGQLTGDTMEPDTFYNSPLAIAADNGDCDGDSRALALILDEAAAKQAMSWNWEVHRKAVFTTYMLNPQDPAVWAFEHDPKKLKWAKPTKTTLAALVDLTTNSIRNQTLHVGTAHSHGHCALVLSDLRLGRAVKAQGLMFGHYEEQLGGLDDNYFKFYESLNRKQKLGTDWEPLMKALTSGSKPNDKGEREVKGIGHSPEDWEAFKAVHSIVEAYGYVGRKQKLHPMMKLDESTIKPEETMLVLLAGIYSRLSKGQLGHPLLRFVVENNLVDLIRRDVPTHSVVGRQVIRFFDKVMPAVNMKAFPGGYVDEWGVD